MTGLFCGCLFNLSACAVWLLLTSASQAKMSDSYRTAVGLTSYLKTAVCKKFTVIGLQRIQILRCYRRSRHGDGCPSFLTTCRLFRQKFQGTFLLENPAPPTEELHVACLRFGGADAPRQSYRDGRLFLGVASVSCPSSLLGVVHVQSAFQSTGSCCWVPINPQRSIRRSCLYTGASALAMSFGGKLHTPSEAGQLRKRTCQDDWPSLSLCL